MTLPSWPDVFCLSLHRLFVVEVPMDLLMNTCGTLLWYWCVLLKGLEDLDQSPQDMRPKPARARKSVPLVRGSASRR